MGCCQSQLKHRGVDDRRRAVRSTRPPPAPPRSRARAPLLPPCLSHTSLLCPHLARGLLRARTVLLLSSLTGAGDSECRTSVGDPQACQRPLHACACGIGIAGHSILFQTTSVCVRVFEFRLSTTSCRPAPRINRATPTDWKRSKVSVRVLCCGVCECVRACPGARYECVSLLLVFYLCDCAQRCRVGFTSA
jgi:hypothetical protein